MEAAAESDSFSASQVRVCGYYPFGFSELQDSFANPIGIFGPRSGLATTFMDLRRSTFSPELAWLEDVQSHSVGLSVIEIKLSTGRALKEVRCSGILIIYQLKFSNLFLAFDFDDTSLSSIEIAELHALVKGTGETIANNAPAVSVRIHDVVHKIRSLAEVFRLVANEFCWSYKTKIPVSRVEFIYPLLYVGKVSGTRNARDLKTRYQKEIAGILDLWIRDSIFLKEREVELIWASDVHPLEYGVTFIGANSIIELHPEGIIPQIARLEVLAVNEHHDRELAFLAVLSETVVSQYFVLRMYAERISSQVRSVRLEPVAFLNPFRLLVQAYGLFRERKLAVEAVGEFDVVLLSRKPYVKNALKQIREKLGVPEAQTTLLRTIEVAAQSAKEAYVMIIAVFALVVSMSSLIVSLSNFMLAIKGK